MTRQFGLNELVTNTDVKKMFGASVRKWRNRRDLSQEELAKRAKLHRTYISDIEQGARNLSLESMVRLARALEISVPALFSELPKEMGAGKAAPEEYGIAAIADPEGKIPEDITERKQMEAELRQSKERYQALFERSLDCVFLTDLGGRILDANQASLNLLGYQREDILTLTFDSLLTEDQLPLAYQVTEEIRTTGYQKHPTEYRLQGKDGREVYVETQASLIYRDGKPFAIQGIARDLTERKRAEASHARLALALDQAAESIIITETNGAIVYVNPAFEKTSGYTRAEVLGQNPRILKSGKQDVEFYRRMWEVLNCGEVWQGHFINVSKAGKLYEEEAAISPLRDAAGKIISYVAVKRDVTREVQLEAKFREAQKMEAFGQLAGGVAHDFNNLLAVIQLQAGLLRSEQNLSMNQLAIVGDLEKAAERGANLTRQLLLFSRKQTMQPCDLNLRDAVANISKMLQRTLGEQVQLQFKFSPESLFLHADPGMIDQILLNLAVNARDAMSKGGQIFMETAAVEFDEATAMQHPQARPGSFVCLSVSDTGCGIPPEILPRIFEPFFTTKDVGKGTGLGLATVFGIVQQHKGWIHVYSEVNQGTTFRVYLPRLTQAPANKPSSSSLASLCGGSETILLVEDEFAVRGTVRTILSRIGYRVLEASTGHEAMAVWKQHREEIRLLLTDLVMPGGINGREMAEQLLQQNPQLKVIYTSGYSADIAGKDFLLEEGVNFLAKPFQAHKLAQTIRQKLDQPGVPKPHTARKTPGLTKSSGEAKTPGN
jgi:PAS domain S-box-containing protein